MLVKVEAYHDGTFWCARGIREDVFTQGRTLDELMKNVKEAVSLHYEDSDTLAVVSVRKTESGSKQYVSFERPQGATDSELDEHGILTRYRGDRLVGVTILNARKRFGSAS